jgi:hypothetical protein
MKPEKSSYKNLSPRRRRPTKRGSKRIEQPRCPAMKLALLERRILRKEEGDENE